MPTTAAAATRAIGVGGPKLFVRRYRVPQALHSIGLEAGPRLHCGESVIRTGRAKRVRSRSRGGRGAVAAGARD